MSVRPETIHLARQWIAKAEEDLKNAEHTLTLEEDCPLGTVCFHAQQCAEKYIKALLTFHGAAFAKTHDLLHLVNLLPAGGSVTVDLSELSAINRFSVESRYPGDWEPITREDAEHAVGVSRKVRDAVRTRLPRSVLVKAED
jgi:HEPN domain-containing protein